VSSFRSRTTVPAFPSRYARRSSSGFGRGDDSTTRRFGGTGLGLTIAKELVERHGGLIEVGDGADGGALFRVTLPFTPEPRAVRRPEFPRPTERFEICSTRSRDRPWRSCDLEASPRSRSAAAARALVLVLEDNQEMSRFLSRLPRARLPGGGRFRRPSGVGAGARAPAGPDLSDVMMPVMGATRFVRELRAHPELEALPIIVLTAKAMTSCASGCYARERRTFSPSPLPPRSCAHGSPTSSC